MQFVHRLYGWLLLLFPKTYREEYSGELLAVFGLSIDDALEKGMLETADVILRELTGLPKAIIHEHLRERRKNKMNGKVSSRFDFPPGSRFEPLAVFLPFIGLYVLFLLIGVLHDYMYSLQIGSSVVGTLTGLVFLGAILSLYVIGFRMGTPRWFLPYLGFLLAVLSLYVFSVVFGTPIYFLFRDFRDQSLLIIDILWDGIYWYGLLFAILLLVVSSRISPKFQRFKNDWTLPCFVLYGGVPFALWVTFDEYVGDEPYTLSAFLVLAIGAWLYLRSAGERTRFGALFIAMTFAMFIVAIGKMLLVPSQTWPITVDGGLARSELGHTITMWVWFALGMMIPLANRFLSHSASSSQVSLPNG